MQLKNIIWDWNGTLLNDLEFCVATINSLLRKRELPLLEINQYKEVFSFPVKEYYSVIGFDFDKEEFEKPAAEFIELIEEGIAECRLHPSSLEILSYFKSQGAKQYVLSAMEHSMLQRTLKHNGILEYFDGYSGLNDHYAASKVALGEELLRNYNIDKNSACIIGDTIHDFEVAEVLAIKCILIADGHQSKERLVATGAPVIDNLLQLKYNSLFSE